MQELKMKREYCQIHKKHQRQEGGYVEKCCLFFLNNHTEIVAERPQMRTHITTEEPW
jgi:hypothetical protein